MHLMVLVGCDCHEYGLGEDECPPVDCPLRLMQNQMDSGLVAVHGIDDGLPKGGLRDARSHIFAFESFLVYDFLSGNRCEWMQTAA